MRLGLKTLVFLLRYCYSISMKTYITLLLSLLFIGSAASPAFAQVKPPMKSMRRISQEKLDARIAGSIARRERRQLRQQRRQAHEIMVTRQKNPAKQILNRRAAYEALREAALKELASQQQASTQISKVGTANTNVGTNFYYEPIGEANPPVAFATNTLQYLHDHPHRPNFLLKEILKTDGVDAALVTKIKQALNRPEISVTDADLSAALQEAYVQYQVILDLAKSDPLVIETVNIYENLAQEYQQFAQKNNRGPVFNNVWERDLYNRVEIILYNNPTNRFGLVMPHIKKLYDLTGRFPAPRLPEPETLAGIRHFFRENHFLPRPVWQRDLLNPVTSEETFFEVMEFWKAQSPNFKQEMDNLNSTLP